jgi:hypothetical protein
MLVFSLRQNSPQLKALSTSPLPEKQGSLQKSYLSLKNLNSITNSRYPGTATEAHS